MREWASNLSLGDWKIYVDFCDRNCLADIHWDITGKCASIDLAKKWVGVEPTLDKIRSTAIHEVCELLTHPLKDLAMQFFREEWVHSRAHEIIIRLENYFAREK